MTGRNRSRVLFLSVFLVALGLRLLYVVQLGSTPYESSLVVDEEMYDERGRAIAGGDWLLGDRPYYQDPFYPYYLGILYKLFGHHLGMVRVIQAFLCAGGAVAVAALANRIAGVWAGLVAGLLFGACRNELFYDAQIEKTGLMVCLVAVALLLWDRAGDHPGSAGRWFVSGLSIGLLALARGNFLAFFPIAAVAVFFISGRRVRPVAALIAGICLAVLPVTVRNYAVSGEIVLVTSQAGQNFYIGNHAENREGTYQPPGFVRRHARYEEVDFAREAERRVGRELTAKEVSAFFWKLSFRDIAADPAQFARNCLLRLAWSLHPVDQPDNYDQRFMSRFIPVLSYPLPSVGLLLVLGIPGLFYSLYRRRRMVPTLVAFTALYVGTLVPFFIFGRYRVPILPALAVGAGLFVIEVVGNARSGRTRAAAGLILAAVATWVMLASLPEVRGQDGMNWNTLGSIYEKRGERDEAKNAYAQARLVEPENHLALYNSARLLMGEGRRQEAVAEFRESIRLMPAPETFANLGACLLELGRYQEARAALNEALARDPTMVQAMFNLALVDEQEGQLANAIKRYDTVVEWVGASSSLGRMARQRRARLLVQREGGR